MSLSCCLVSDLPPASIDRANEDQVERTDRGSVRKTADCDLRHGYSAKLCLSSCGYAAVGTSKQFDTENQTEEFKGYVRGISGVNIQASKFMDAPLLCVYGGGEAGTGDKTLDGNPAKIYRKERIRIWRSIGKK